MVHHPVCRPLLASRWTRWAVISGLCLNALTGAAAARPTQTAAGLSPQAEACAALNALGDGTHDASASLKACLAATPPGGMVALPPGRYLLNGPLVVDRPVTITTRGVGHAAPTCGIVDRRCATLVVRPQPGAIASGQMPITVPASGVTLDHLIFAGGGDAQFCRDPARRPSAGGLRTSGDDLVLTASALTGFACYTSLEMQRGARGRIERDLFARNGDHAEHLMWSDGLTVHDASRLVVVHNRFVDNTDVQLIFGGCIDCTIVENRFRHTGAASGGSFAELMIQAWPRATSGRYDGTRVAGNDIDCGVRRRCGFGLMLGSTPWYDAPTSGGSIVGNRITNAILPVNIDGLTGQMTVASNRIVGAPAGQVSSTCGPINVTSVVNVSPASQPFVRGDAAATAGATARSFRGCLLNPSS